MKKTLSCTVIVCSLICWISVAQTSNLSTASDESARQTNALTRWELAAREDRKLTENITWLTHEPIAFLMRRGDHFDDEPERTSAWVTRRTLNAWRMPESVMR